MSLENYRGELMKSDASLYPSYTRLVVPYRVLCRQRYQRNARHYARQFLKEHRRLELLQLRALDGVRIHKEFCENVLSAPIKDDLLTFTPKQQKRLEYLLENPIF